MKDSDQNLHRGRAHKNTRLIGAVKVVVVVVLSSRSSLQNQVQKECKWSQKSEEEKRRILVNKDKSQKIL